MTPTQTRLLLGALAGETLAALRSRCRDMGLRGYSRLNRKQLQQLILDATRD